MLYYYLIYNNILLYNKNILNKTIKNAIHIYGDLNAPPLMYVFDF